MEIFRATLSLASWRRLPLLLLLLTHNGGDNSTESIPFSSRHVVLTLNPSATSPPTSEAVLFKPDIGRVCFCFQLADPSLALMINTCLTI